MIILGFIFVVLVIGVWSYKANEKRRARLLAKYGDPEIVDLIMNKDFWQGASKEQIIDSLGKPLDIDRKVMKTKTKTVWKYHHQGKNRFGLRIFFENGVVVGWEEK